MAELENTDTLSVPLSNPGSHHSIPPRAQKNLKILGWIFFSFFCLIFFTLLKLPTSKIKNYIQATLAATLSPQGISLTTAETSLSMAFGITYKMKDVTLSLPPPTPAAHVDQIEISPSLTSLILGRMGGKVRITHLDGKLKASFSIKNTEFSLSFDARNFNLGKSGILPAATGVRGSLIANGDFSVSGDFNNLALLSGAGQLNLDKINLEPQSIQGFSVPAIAISEGKLDFTIEKGKVTLKTLKLGKPGNPGDDLIATASGEILFSKLLDSSTLHLKTRFSLSQNILKSFVLIDALLGPGKQGDGSYGFNLSGPIYSPNSTPLGPNEVIGQ